MHFCDLHVKNEFIYSSHEGHKSALNSKMHHLFIWIYHSFFSPAELFRICVISYILRPPKTDVWATKLMWLMSICWNESVWRFWRKVSKNRVNEPMCFCLIWCLFPQLMFSSPHAVRSVVKLNTRAHNLRSHWLWISSSIESKALRPGNPAGRCLRSTWNI